MFIALLLNFVTMKAFTDPKTRPLTTKAGIDPITRFITTAYHNRTLMRDKCQCDRALIFGRPFCGDVVIKMAVVVCALSVRCVCDAAWHRGCIDFEI